jgi:hypothetical protein
VLFIEIVLIVIQTIKQKVVFSHKTKKIKKIKKTIKLIRKQKILKVKKCKSLMKNLV